MKNAPHGCTQKMLPEPISLTTRSQVGDVKRSLLCFMEQRARSKAMFVTNRSGERRLSRCEGPSRSRLGWQVQRTRWWDDSCVHWIVPSIYKVCADRYLLTVSMFWGDRLQNGSPYAIGRCVSNCRVCNVDLWHLTFDLSLQTGPSERPNTSFAWIWRKSIQRYISCTNKKHTVTALKTEASTVHCVR